MSERLHAFADRAGGFLVDAFHDLALFAIGGAIAWSGAHAFIGMAAKGVATIDDILLLALATLVVRYGSARFPSQPQGATSDSSTASKRRANPA